METTDKNQTATAAENAQNSNQKIATKQKKNQLVFVEYEQPTEAGHKITLVDSYRNILGRIYEKYDPQTGKFEYTFCDEKDVPQFSREGFEELKSEIFKQKSVMLEKAHERRKELSNKRWRDQSLKKEPMSVAFPKFGRKGKYQHRKQEQKLQPEKKQEKTPDQKNPMSITEREKQYQAWKREQELNEHEREAQLRLEREDKLRQLEELRESKEQQNMEQEITR